MVRVTVGVRGDFGTWRLGTKDNMKENIILTYIVYNAKIEFFFHIPVPLKLLSSLSALV